MRSAVCRSGLPRLSLPRVDTDAFYFWPALPAGLINSVFAASLTVLRPTNSKLAGKLLDTKGSRGRGYVHGTLQGKGYAKHLDCKLCCSRMSLTSPISCDDFLQPIHLTAVYTLQKFTERGVNLEQFVNGYLSQMHPSLNGTIST